MAPSPVRAVHLEAVSYTYPRSNRRALAELAYSFPTGTTAIVGPNGAGKSTLVKLLTGLLAPTCGSIGVELLDGTCLPPERADKAVLFQEPSHLYLTIRQNVTMRFERTPGEDRRVHDALEVAGLSGVVAGLPDGIDTLVGAGFGGQLDLSGGQWQRLALARLVYQDAPVMILDEPVASLDPEGERAVFELFARMSQAKVIVFTTHRYDSIPKDTTIVVLVDGRIAEIGTHEELIERQRHYWSLWAYGRDHDHNGRLRSTTPTAPREPGAAVALSNGHQDGLSPNGRRGARRRQITARTHPGRSTAEQAAPPDPLDAWTAEIEWRETGGGARFCAVARAADGTSPTAVAQSPALEWPPTGTASVKALTDAVEQLEALLVAAGWSVLPVGSAWYAKRFCWEPVATTISSVAVGEPVLRPSNEKRQHVR